MEKITDNSKDVNSKDNMNNTKIINFISKYQNAFIASAIIFLLGIVLFLYIYFSRYY